MDEQQIKQARFGGWRKRVVVILGIIAVIVLAFLGLWRAGVLGFLDTGEVIIIVNGEGLVKQEFDWYMADSVKAMQQRGGEVSEEATAEVRQQVLQRMIDQQLIYEQGIRLEITATAEEIEAAWQRRLSGYPDEKAFAAKLAAAGMNIDYYRELIAQEIVLNKTVELQMKDVQIAEAEIKQLYEANKARFEKAPEEVKAAHILLMVNEGADEGAVLSRVKEIRKKALAGQDFGELAASYSEEPGAAERRGELGYFTRGQMVKPFEDAVFVMKVGEISAPVKTRFGYHLIKLLDRLPAGRRSFEQAKEMLSRAILDQQKRQRFMAFLTELRMKAEIEFKPGFEVAPPPGGGVPGQR